ncbi:hypothetical protein [Vibrio splendidus]|uniref:hypothetical protein n=1 Tax=Vibrio splendidus TaxID=29497 RepID=UPI001C06B1C0|nr:hypothetical protein [Vibrio splendidus]MBU2909462.1 hypothetical protein [Vibrio splendidus]MDO6529404.1 hypothetical protein [Vibrio splendidus]MDO6550459.1 hypothetical protein [Vibrio splendidus]
MPKFKQGETSQGVLDKKNSITQSMIKKTLLINKIKSIKDIPASLVVKNGVISEASVQKWKDDALKITSYARNSAHADHNDKPLKSLLLSIRNANTRINSSTEENANSPQSNKVKRLEEENSQLKLALAEVYRAYMQLLNEYREDREIDEKYRELLLKQAKALGKNRIWKI